MEGTNGTIKIDRRPATADDMEFVRQTHHKAYHDVVEIQFGTWDDKVQDKFFEFGWNSSKNHEIILCNDQPCGYYSFKEADNFFILNEIVLLPEYQGKGIGTKIMNEMIDKAKTKKIPARLKILKANKARSFYKRLGFRDIEQTDKYFKMEFDPNKRNSLN